MRIRLQGVILGLACCCAAGAQELAVPEAVKPAVETPLPDLESLLKRALQRSDSMQELQKSYMCKEVAVADEFDSKGTNTGTHSNEYQVFFVGKHEIHQHTAHDGKPLSEKDARKEQERVDKLTADIKSGKLKDRDEVTPKVSEMLQLVTVSTPRREIVGGRSTIFFDFEGNPKAAAHGPIQEVVKRLRGTLAIDEAEAAIVHVDGTLQENFHLLGGLLINVKKGSHFERNMQRVNDEIWFVRSVTYHGDGRFLLFKGFNGDGSYTFSDYRKMKASVTLRPGSQVIGEDGKPMQDSGADREMPAVKPR